MKLSKDKSEEDYVWKPKRDKKKKKITESSVAKCDTYQDKVLSVQ